MKKVCSFTGSTSMLKILAISLLMSLVAVQLRAQTPTDKQGYAPKVFSFGNLFNQLRTDSAQHIPHKYGLTLNTTDSTPQIFAWSTPSGDSLILYVHNRYIIIGAGAFVNNLGNATGIQTGAFLSRPAAGHLGNFYGSTDSLRWSFDNGTSWIDLGGSGGGGGGGGGVVSFNTRTGAVTLTSGDVTTALGFTPLATVSTTNSVAGSGTSPSPVQLVGDAASPGNSQYYGTDGSGAKGYHALPSGVAGANPTASVGLSPINGSATTFMRSDAAPNISQAIAPTWSGTHTFSLAPIFSSLTGYLYGNGAGAITASTTIPTAGIAANAVTNSVLAQMTANGFKGNNTGGTSNVIDLTPAQAAALLNAYFVQNAGSFTSVKVGPFLSRPSPSGCACAYISVDSGFIDYDNTSSWVRLGGGNSTGGFNKYLYNLYPSPSLLPVMDNVDQFVDSWHGSNSNNGTSEGTPKQTIASALTVANSDASVNGSSRISLRDSGIYHEAVTPGSNGIRINTYRPGYNTFSRPAIITGADTQRVWTKFPGYTNIYYKVISNNLGTGNPGYDFQQVIETDTNFVKIAPFTARHYLTYVSRLSLCDSTAGSMWVNTATGAYTNPDTIYVHTTPGGSPDSVAYEYEVTTREQVVSTANPIPGIKNTWLSGLILRDAATGYGSFSAGDSSFMSQCFIQGGGTHGTVMNWGTVDNCVYSMGTVTPAGQITLAFYNAQGKGRYNKLTNSVLFNTPDAVICHQSGSDSGYMEQFYLENDYMWSNYASALGISEDLCKQVVVRNCYLHGFGTGFNLGHGNNLFEKVIIDSCTLTNEFTYPGDPSQHDKMWNVIINTVGQGAGFGTQSILLASDSAYLDLRQSLLYDKTSGSVATSHSFISGTGNVAGTIKSFNNIFISTNFGAAIGQYAVAVTSNTNSHSTPYSYNYTGDYNCWIIGPGAPGIQWNFANNSGGVSTHSLATWQATTGQDLHSVVIDVSHNPLGLKAIFVDPDHGNWQLLPPGNALADTVRAHYSGLASAVTSYPTLPTIEDAVYAMQAGGPPSMAARWVAASAAVSTPQGTDTTDGIVQPSQTYFANNLADTKLATVGGPVDVGFSANNNVISNIMAGGTRVWYAMTTSNQNSNYAVGDKKISAYSDGWIQYLFAPDSSCQWAFVGLSPGNTAVSFGNYYIGCAIYTSGGLYYQDGYGSLTSAAFTPTTYTWIRIRRKSGVITLETSTDEKTWTIRHTYTNYTDQDLYPIISMDNSQIAGRAHIFSPKIYNFTPINTVNIPNGPYDETFTTANNLVRNVKIWRGTSSASFLNNYGIAADKKLTKNGWLQAYLSNDSAVQYSALYLSTNDSAQKYSGVKVPFAVAIYTSNVFYVIDGLGGSLTSTGVTRQINSWWRLNRNDSTVTFETSPDNINWTVQYTFTTKYTGDLYPQIAVDNTVSPSHIFSPEIGFGQNKNTASINYVNSFSNIQNYSQNFGSWFTARSYVDRNYVDSSIAASGGGGSHYQMVQSNGAAQTVQPILNFTGSPNVSNNSGNTSTDVHLPGVIFSDTAVGTALTNSTTLTSILGNGVGASVTGANVLKAGDVITYDGAFLVSTASSSPGTLTFSTLDGSGGLAYVGTPPVSLSNSVVRFHAVITIIRTGSSGSAAETIDVIYPNTDVIATNSTYPFNSTVSHTWTALAQWGSALSANSIQAVMPFYIKIE